MSGVATKDTTMFSLGVVKEYLVVSDSSQDALIGQIADAVSAKFEQRTRRCIVTRTITDTWNGAGGRAHFLSRMDVSAISSLTVNGIAIDPATVALDRRLGMIQIGAGAAVCAFGCGVGNCIAVFTAGLDVQDGPNLPDDVIEACLEWVKAIYDEKSSGATSATTVSLGPASLVLKPGLGFNIKDTIDAWRDVRA